MSIDLLDKVGPELFGGEAILPSDESIQTIGQVDTALVGGEHTEVADLWSKSIRSAVDGAIAGKVFTSLPEEFTPATVSRVSVPESTERSSRPGSWRRALGISAAALLLSATAACSANNAAPVKAAQVCENDCVNSNLTRAVNAVDPKSAASSTLEAPRDFEFGLYTPDNAMGYGDIKKSGLHPQVALYYSGWWEHFQTNFAREAHRHGAEELAELQTCGDPCNATTGSEAEAMLEAIVAGGENNAYDTYLINFAESVKSFGHPVLVTFDHEQNGSWYPWSSENVSPQLWVAAYRKVASIFKTYAPNVSILWAPNVVSKQTTAIRDYWPGNKYVDLIGIDGYFNSSSATPRSVFNKTIEQVRRLTKKPIVISETGIIGTDNQAAVLKNLYDYMATTGLEGLFYFDKNQGPGHDYALSPAAVTVINSHTAGHPK